MSAVHAGKMMLKPSFLLLSTVVFCLAKYASCQNDTSTDSAGAAAAAENVPLSAPVPNAAAASRRYRSKKDRISEAIRKQGKNWVAAINPDFENVTDFRTLLGAVNVELPAQGVVGPPGSSGAPGAPAKGPGSHPEKSRKLPPKRGNATDSGAEGSSRFKRASNLPTRYDVRNDYPECPSLGSIRYQYRCGSCWAVTAASAMSDRHCIYNFYKSGQIYISPLHIISCVPNGCEGGKEWDAYEYWIKSGLVTGGTAYTNANQPTGCLPYPYGIDRTPSSCPTSCSVAHSKTFDQDKIYGGDYKQWWFPSIETIQREIWYYGPVVAFFTVYEDFMYYKTGVYEHVNGTLVGYHLTKLIGWGTEGGIDYWQAVNTWGTNWGQSGTFKIRRGVNMVGIEARISSVVPKEAVPS